MSDYELGKKLYRDVANGREIAIARVAAQLDAEDKQLTAYNPVENAVIEDATAIVMAVGKWAVYQRCRPKRTFFFHPDQPRLSYKRIGGGWVDISTPLFGKQLDSYNELAIEFGWSIEFGLKPRDGIREYPLVQNYFLHSGFKVKRVATGAAMANSVDETWYTVLPQRAPGKVVESHQAANDIEKQVTLKAAFDEEREDYGENAIERSSRIIKNAPLAGARALAHCQQLLVAARAELNI